MPSPDQDSFWRKVLQSVVTYIACGVIVGLAVAYLTVQELSTKVEHNTQVSQANAAAIEDANEKIHQNEKSLNTVQRATSERLIRLETKIDLLLSGRLKGGEND